MHTSCERVRGEDSGLMLFFKRASADSPIGVLQHRHVQACDLQQGHKMRLAGSGNACLFRRYGGHIVNDFDRLLANEYLDWYMKDELLDETELYPFAEDEKGVSFLVRFDEYCTITQPCKPVCVLCARLVQWNTP